RQGAGVGNGTGRERDHYEGHADEDGEDHADHGAPLLKAFCRLLTRVVPPAFAERTKNAQFLPRWCRRSGSNRRPAAYKAAALPLSYGGDGPDCTPPRRFSGLIQFSLVCPGAREFCVIWRCPVPGAWSRSLDCTAFKAC